MKYYKSKKEAEKDVVNGELLVDDDVTFEFDLNCNWHIIARNIKALNIRAFNIQSWDIWARNIKALGINARNIDAYDIDALGIKAYNIKAYDIEALDIKARDIKAYNIDARDIGFYGYAIAYNTFKCRSIVGQRENARYSCLDSEVIITGYLQPDSTASSSPV